jgi:hypothetical protein
VVLILALHPPTDDLRLMIVVYPMCQNPMDLVHGIVDLVHTFSLGKINMKIVEIP